MFDAFYFLKIFSSLSIPTFCHAQTFVMLMLWWPRVMHTWLLRSLISVVVLSGLLSGCRVHICGLRCSSVVTFSKCCLNPCWQLSGGAHAGGSGVCESWPSARVSLSCSTLRRWMPLLGCSCTCGWNVARSHPWCQGSQTAERQDCSQHPGLHQGLDV